jgi:hypothetical protein
MTPDQFTELINLFRVTALTVVALLGIIAGMMFGIFGKMK